MKKILNKIKSEQNGAVTLLVAYTILMFIIILVGVYTAVSMNAESQLKSNIKVRQIYKADVDKVDQIYEEQEAKYIEKNMGYVTAGLLLHYDGIQNTFLGHDSNTTTWADLVSNNNQGILNGCTWNDSGLAFDGSDDWVNIGQMNLANMTIQVVMEYLNQSNNEREIICNLENGGYAIGTFANNSVAYKTKNAFSVQLEGEEDCKYIASSNDYVAGKKYFLSGSYDGNTIKFAENDSIYINNNVVGTVKIPQNSTNLILGANPSGNTASSAYAPIKVYSVRIYNRVLTNEEIQKNYEIDKVRFGLE